MVADSGTRRTAALEAGQLSALPFINDTHGRDSFQLYRSSTTHTGGTAFSSTVHQRHTRAGQLSALPSINDTHGWDSFQLYRSSTTHTGGTAFSSTVHQRHTRATHTYGTAFSSTVHQRHTRAGQLSALPFIALPFINDIHGRDSFQLYRPSTTHTIRGHSLTSFIWGNHTKFIRNACECCHHQPQSKW